MFNTDYSFSCLVCQSRVSHTRGDEPHPCLERISTSWRPARPCPTASGPCRTASRADDSRIAPLDKPASAEYHSIGFRSGCDQPATKRCAPVAQLDRASDSDSEGHRFDSCRVYTKKALARQSLQGLFFISKSITKIKNRRFRLKTGMQHGMQKSRVSAAL